MKPDEFQKAYGKLVAAAWADEDIKQRLMESPKEVLKEYGVEMPEGVDIRVVEDTPEIKNLVLPVMPDNIDFEVLDERQAASFFACCPYCQA